ncbi:KdsC family phosphatase [Desulfotalea psychrophila]|nr:HAD hydrolase family protein [Desulfotalea psychrophila]
MTGSEKYPSDCQILEEMRTQAREQISTSPARQCALARAKDIKLLLLDVDGVLTNGSLLYTGEEIESKSFHTLDGFGLQLLREAEVATGIITARRSAVVARRAKELKMTYIYQGAMNKNIAFKEILAESGLKPFEVAYMGDDWLDLVILQQVGLATTPANGAPEVQERVHFSTKRSGGFGAVREVCDLIIEGKGLKETLLQKYLNK